MPVLSAWLAGAVRSARSSLTVATAARRARVEPPSHPAPAGPMPLHPEVAVRVMQTLGQGIAVITPDGGLFRVNEAYARMLGHSVEELVGRGVCDNVLAEDEPALTAARDRWLAGHEASVEVRMHHRDGETVYALMSGVPRVVDGAVVSVIAIFTDTSERHRAKEALHASEERYRLLVDGVQEVIYQVGSGGEWTFLNEAWTAITGFTVAESLGQPFLAFVHPDDVDRVRAEATALAAGGQGEGRAELRYRTRAGGYRWMEAHARLTFNTTGMIAGLSGTLTDITERRVAEEAAHEREQTLRALIDASPDVIVLVGPDGRIRSVSPAATSLTGHSEAYFVGHTAMEIAHPDDAAAIVAGLTGIFTEAGRGEARLRIGCADGSWLTLEARGRALTDAAGTMTGAMVVARDVTEQVQMTDALAQAREQAEEASHAKTEFLSRVSHELRTPLNAILGFAQLLQMDPLAPDQVEGVEHILKAGHHLLALINDVLDISRIETGRMSLSVEPVQAGDCLRGAIDLVRPLAETHGIHLLADEAMASTLYTLADQQRLRQVLINLLTNGVKYNLPGGQVRVSAGRDGDERVYLDVADTGPGIPPEKLARLFTPFDRLGAEQTEIEGTGIGLALSRRLMEMMGGTIEATSVAGRGSTFRVVLRAAPAAPPEHDAGTPPPNAGDPAVCTGAPTRSVLYIEDNLFNLRLVQRIMRGRPSVQFLSATEGGAGIALAREHCPDLILLDLNLPDLEWPEIVGRLRADPHTAPIPIVVVSADATPGQAARLRDAGIHAYITKPLEIPAFLRVLDGVLFAGAA